VDKIIFVLIILVSALFLFGCTQSLENRLPYCIPSDINSSYILAQNYVEKNSLNSFVEFDSFESIDSCENESKQGVRFSVVNKDTNALSGLIIVKNENSIEYKSILSCNTVSDCDYRQFTGACYNTEVVNQTLKDAQANGMHIGEAPPIDGVVSCTCEQNKCVTNIVK